MMRRPSPPAGEAGFALAEALVATAIIAAAMGVTYEAVQNNARAAARVQDERQAALLGQSKLAEVGSVIPLSPGARSGRSGALVWQVAIGGYGERSARDAAPPLLTVDVSIRHADEPRPLLVLHSLRVGA